MTPAPKPRPRGRARPAVGLLATLALLPALLPASACIHLGPEGTRTPPDLYELTALRTAPAAAAGGKRILAVEEPRAPGALSGDRIAVRPAPHRLAYLAGGRWTEAAPRMVGRLLRESVAASGRFAAVGPREAGLRADVRLALEILAFEADLPDGEERGRARIRIAALLIAEPRGEVLASRTFHAEAAAPERSRTALVAAFDEAFHQLTDELVGWLAMAPTAEESGQTSHP